MTMPFYVSPEQVMKDRADYARKGIARGRSLVAMSTVDGIVIVAENPSRTLNKISEIYDRIAFAGVGKYNEFEMLRIAGVRQADHAERGEVPEAGIQLALAHREPHGVLNVMMVVVERFAAGEQRPVEARQIA